LFLFVVFSFGSIVTYRGEKVLSVTVPDDQKLHLLKEILRFNGDSDVWTNEGEIVIGQNHIMVKNTTEVAIKRYFKTEVFIEDVQKLMDQIKMEHSKNMQEKQAKGIPGDFFDDYRRYADIVTELKTLASQYPSLTKFNPSIGKSVQGRDIPAITISASGFANQTIKRIFWQGGQHAREWIGPATVMYQIVQLLKGYGNDPLVTSFLQNMEFVVVPISNPDGYEYAHTTQRLWRKNRKANSGGSFGVDLNRNWNDHWCQNGASKVPTSDTYCGTGPFSEPETLVISQFINQNNQQDNILAAIDFHSYSQLILRPYGWTSANSPDNAELKIIGDGVSFEIQAKSGKKYVSQKSIELYVTTGSAGDWYYGPGGIWASYTIELRDTGTYGFLLPPAQIVPTGDEIWESMRYFCSIVLDTNPRRK